MSIENHLVEYDSARDMGYLIMLNGMQAHVLAEAYKSYIEQGQACGSSVESMDLAYPGIADLPGENPTWLVLGHEDESVSEALSEATEMLGYYAQTLAEIDESIGDLSVAEDASELGGGQRPSLAQSRMIVDQLSNDMSVELDVRAAISGLDEELNNL